LTRNADENMAKDLRPNDATEKQIELALKSPDFNKIKDTDESLLW
jgi:hypothetical protein